MLRLKSPKRVVYTCLFGNYETLNEQHCQNKKNIKFICFTDRDDLTSATWDIRRINTIEIGSSRESRRPKLLPHLYLSDYDESLYIDNRVVLKTDPSSLFDEFLPRGGPGFVCLRHPWRNCIFDEAEVIIKNAMDDESRVREQMDVYRNAGFPPGSGLIAGGFILRRHNQADVKRVSEIWFNHILRYSKRDQLSFNFIAWRENFSYKAIDLKLNSNPLFDWPVGERRIPYDFNAQEYLWLNPDVARACIDPHEHMFKFGYNEKRRYKYRNTLVLDKLANKYRTDKGSLYYNRHFYTRIYEYYLSPLRREEFTLLEIGLLRHDVQKASEGKSFDDTPSLYMWDDYFERAQIHGIDIADFSQAVRGKITFTQADQSNLDDLTRAVQRCNHEIRVIIDDASHASHHQQISLAFLFKHLARGGIYFIEDLGYQPPHLEKKDALKTRDFLYALQKKEPCHSPFISDEDVKYLVDEIAEIRFFDSMDYMGGPNSADALAVIRKR